jgi:uncharacterized protein with GYD domain
MPKYLFEGDYSAEGTRGLLKDGGSKRKAVVAKALKKMGGKLDAMYFTFGIRDVICIVDLPDNVSAAAVSLAVSSSGSIAFKTTVLLTPEEVDQASTKQDSGYTPPGA